MFCISIWQTLLEDHLIYPGITWLNYILPNIQKLDRLIYEIVTENNFFHTCAAVKLHGILKVLP